MGTRALPTGRDLFRSVAPRLERAHRERTAIRTQLRRERETERDIVHNATWRVDHRELLILRSRHRKYIASKQVKLDKARAELAAARQRLQAVEERLRAA